MKVLVLVSIICELQMTIDECHSVNIKLTCFSSQIGLSGTKNNPIKFKIGNDRHNQLSCTQLRVAPTQNTNRMPMVKNNWKQVPSDPRIDVSANSLMKTGATTHDPPITTPVEYVQIYEIIAISLISFIRFIAAHDMNSYDEL